MSVGRPDPGSRDQRPSRHEAIRLFDAGYVTITPDFNVRVSERLRLDWQNGHRYYPFDGQPLVAVPEGALAPRARQRGR